MTVPTVIAGQVMHIRTTVTTVYIHMLLFLLLFSLSSLTGVVAHQLLVARLRLFRLVRRTN